MQPLLSAEWYRVSRLKPRLRLAVRVRRQTMRGARWYLLCDDATGRQHLINEAAFGFIGRCDGTHDVQTVWDALLTDNAENAPTQSEVLELLVQLDELDLLQCERSADTELLFRRHDRRRRRRRRSMINPFSFRFSLGDPSRWLPRLDPIAHALFRPAVFWFWLAAVVLAGCAAAANWDALVAHGRELMGSPRAMLLAWLCFPVMKTLHELGHALAVRRWGGEVREFGIGLMLLVPAPYMDASAASAFERRSQRAGVAVAGIMVELALFALAMLVWIGAQAGAVRDIAFVVMGIGGVSTVAFNGNVSLARDEIAADHPLQVTLTQVHRTAVRGRSLVQQILAFSRRQPQAFVVQPLRPLIEETVGMLRPMLPAMVSVETSFANASAWVEADSTQIHQVLINLCVNAWHAMQGSTGCIQIGLEVIDGAAGVPPASVEGPRAHLWVRDNGSGMDAETRARIFEPFFTTKSGHGTGLGLAVVHGIVLAHRGSISVDSTVGGGSTFHLLFPLAPEPADEAPAWLPSARGELPSAEGRHVLYVDDDEVMTLMVERLLQRSGYRVSAFHDARAALEVVKADPHAFDVAVCDFNMPALSGLDFARALASIRPQLPVIISSGHLPEEAQVEALQLGVRGLLQKQNTFDELDRLIRRVLADPPRESA